MDYRVVLIESEEGFAVSCPALRGCHSQGKTKAEALENIREAIHDWLDAEGDEKSVFAINHLARVMPFGEAMYLMLTGDTLSVEEAHRLGFVHEIVEPERLMPRAVEIAELIGANAPLAVQATKTVA